MPGFGLGMVGIQPMKAICTWYPCPQKLLSFGRPKKVTEGLSDLDRHEETKLHGLEHTCRCTHMWCVSHLASAWKPSREFSCWKSGLANNRTLLSLQQTVSQINKVCHHPGLLEQHLSSALNSLLNKILKRKTRQFLSAAW